MSCREYSARDESRCDCDKLQQVLEALPGARRMVVSTGVGVPGGGQGGGYEGLKDWVCSKDCLV